MKPISQFEPSKPASRTMTQLTAIVAELRKEVCNLETSIEDEEHRAPSVRARIFHAPPPIVAHHNAGRPAPCFEDKRSREPDGATPMKMVSAKRGARKEKPRSGGERG